MRTILLAIAVGGTALASVVSGQTPPPLPNPSVRPAAMNGPMTRDAYLADAARRFAEMDTDHDGRVTAGERTAYREAMRDRRIADGATPPPPGPPPHRGDQGDRASGGWSGGQGRDITRDDYLARAAKRFDRMDANHDGLIDASEMAAMRDMRGRGPRGQDAPPPPPPGSE